MEVGGPVEGGSHSQRRCAPREGGYRREERERRGLSPEAVAVSEAGSGPSLDLGENNSTRPEDAVSGENGDEGRGQSCSNRGADRYDCRQAFSELFFAGPDDATAPYRCDSWDCYCCGYRMRQNLVEEIKRVTTERPAIRRLMTLTLDPSMAPASREEQHRHLTERWNALRTAISREIGDFSFIWVREEQDSGLPHLHILVSRFIEQSWLSRRWAELGGGEIVDIRHVDRVEKAAHYIGKYLTKNAMSGLPDGTRRYGSSQDIDLDVRGGGDSDDEWELLKEDEILGGPRPVVNADFIRDHPPPD